jgi:diamine N-acetyltransferase
MLTFKAANENDINLIQQLAHTIWHSHYPGIITVEQIEYMLEVMYSASTINKELKEGHQWILLFLEDIPIGFISFFFDKEHNTVKLNKLYVLQTYHGLGFGQQALEYVKNCAAELGASDLYLTVNKLNKKAINAYSKAGFKIENSVITDIGKGYVMDDYIMNYKIH